MDYRGDVPRARQDGRVQQNGDRFQRELMENEIRCQTKAENIWNRMSMDNGNTPKKNVQNAVDQYLMSSDEQRLNRKIGDIGFEINNKLYTEGENRERIVNILGEKVKSEVSSRIQQGRLIPLANSYLPHTLR